VADAVLVTLADEGFLDQARQLFSCAHFQAGWDGDLLLLAHDVQADKLEDFVARGIQVEPCPDWLGAERGEDFHPPTVLSKFDVFGPALRRWEQVVYLDGDMMFWASLAGLARVRGLHAVCERRPLAAQYSQRRAHPELAAELDTRVSLDAFAFNSGLLAFATRDIEEDACQRLRELYLRYRECQAHPFGDQPALNLHFFGRWKLLPDFYAAIRDHSARWFHLEEDELRMIGKHFAGYPRPWQEGHPRYDEWCANLARFAELDARSPQSAAQVWSAGEIRRYWTWLRARRAWYAARERWERARTELRRTAPARRMRWLARRVRALLGG
jgi:hypothetical protein